MEKKKKKREIVIGVVSALAIMAAIILVICLGTTIQSIVDNRKNDDRTVKVLEELQTAIDGGEESKIVRLWIWLNFPGNRNCMHNELVLKGGIR